MLTFSIDFDIFSENLFRYLSFYDSKMLLFKFEMSYTPFVLPLPNTRKHNTKTEK